MSKTKPLMNPSHERAIRIRFHVLNAEVHFIPGGGLEGTIVSGGRGDVRHLTQSGPWEGAESPRQLARSAFRLMNARRNPGNRLSGSSKSRVLDELDDGLLALAESDLASANLLRIERLRQFAPRTEQLGLQGLAVGLNNFIVVPNSRTVLRCSYLCQLHRRAMPLST